MSMKSYSSLHELKQIVSAEFVFTGKISETVTGKIIIIIIIVIQYYREIIKGLLRKSQEVHKPQLSWRWRKSFAFILFIIS